VRIFEDLPLHIKAEVIERGEVIQTKESYELRVFLPFQEVMGRSGKETKVD